MEVRVVGCGEAFDSGLGNNSFVLRVTGGPTVLIDCGYQIPERLWESNLHRSIDAIYFTHTHADHAFGIVPLLTRFWEERRSRPLTILGHRGVQSFVRKALDLGFPGMSGRIRYPIEHLAVRPGPAIEWEGLEVRCARSEHSVTNLSVRFEHRGKSVAFSGDGAITAETAALYADTDVLFHELFSVRREVPGHTNLTALRRLAADIRAQRICVSHHSRRYKEPVRRAIRKLAEKPSERARWVSVMPGQIVSV